MGGANAVSAAASIRSPGQVAQLVEQGTENPRVGGSIPSLATLVFLFLAPLAGGCRSILSDKCDSLCGEVAERIDACRGDAPWSDFGASRRADWISRCQSDWEARSADLSARDLELALSICDDARVTVPGLSCDDVIALYGNGD
jgi:hypothetical protein